MLTMHTKDRALEMITKLSDPANGFEIRRRFLGRVGAGAQRTVPSDADAVAAVSIHTEGRPWRSGSDSCGSERHRVQTRFGIRSKSQYWHTFHSIQNGESTLDKTRRGCRGTMLSELNRREVHKAHRQGAWRTGTRPRLWKSTRSRRARRKARIKRKAKARAKRRARQRQTKGRSTGQVERHARKDCPKFTGWLAQKKDIGTRAERECIEEEGRIFAMHQSPVHSWETKRHRCC